MARIKNESAKRALPRTGLRSAKRLIAAISRGHPRRAEHLDRLLDDALEQTFPASDAIAVVLARGD
jgi:hypothetical protein